MINPDNAIAQHVEVYADGYVSDPDGTIVVPEVEVS